MKTEECAQSRGNECMKLEYRSFEEAQKCFQWSERWQVFDESPDHLNITYECVDRHPARKVAIRLKRDDGGTETYTFGQLRYLSSQVANMLQRRGINRGDRVALILGPSIQYYAAFFGTLRRGAVAVPCYALLGPDGIEHRLKTSGARTAIISEERKHCVPPGLVSDLITSEELLDLIAKESTCYEADTSADTLALIQFSSGTTGQPKPLPYPHGAISVTAVFTKFWLGLRDDDLYMCNSSPAWGHGIWYGTVGPLIFGNGIGSYAGKFTPEMFLEGLQEFGITVVSTMPRVYKMIMDSGKIDNYKLNLRRLTYTGGKIDSSVLEYFKAKCGLEIGSNYGNTESGPLVIDFAFDDWKVKRGSAGKPMLGVKMGILDEHGNELPPGESGSVAVWRKGRWNHVGDSGHFDAEGYFWPEGRTDDVIKSSGYRIGPFEIEAVIEKHRAVERSAVVGSPDGERGEIVKAFVVLKSEFNPRPELATEIQDFVKARLSMHEYPREIEFIDEIPVTPDGKLKRRELKMREYEKKSSQLNRVGAHSS
ncbi:MAG: acyl-CoA synthetase [Terriglobales bacterium]